MPTDQPAADHLTTPRVYYTEGRVRASDLRERDVLNVPGHGWREVLDVWTDDDADRVRADAEFTHDKELASFINEYLTGVSMYVLVRHMHEKRASVEIPYRIAPYRRCDLVTIQVMDPTLPGTPLIERYPALQRLLTEQPTGQWKSPARPERY